MQKLNTAVEIVDLAALRRANPDAEAVEDAELQSLLSAAIAVIETATGHPMAEEDFRFELPAAKFETYWFPVRPVKSLAAVQWRAAGGEWQGEDAGGAYLRSEYDEPQLVVPSDLQQILCNADEARVEATVGGAVDPQQNQAVVLLVGEWISAGIALDSVTAHDLSFGVQALIRQVRYRRPKVIN